MFQEVDSGDNGFINVIPSIGTALTPFITVYFFSLYLKKSIVLFICKCQQLAMNFVLLIVLSTFVNVCQRLIL